MPREKGRPSHAVIRVDTDIGKKHKKIGELSKVIDHLRHCLDSQPDYFGMNESLDNVQDEVVLDILESPGDSPVKISLLFRSVLQSPVELSEQSIHRYTLPRVEEEVITVREVTLTRGMVALVDVADFEQLCHFEWEASFTQAVYALRKFKNEDGRRIKVKMHDQIANTPEGYKVTHLDGNMLNNTRGNLALVEK